mmetsp:Transcript_21094/g.32442  ORF Transcript_21094/g.32442 Transcript_21094/m.32442 type:complete len:669 (-) Transcript_21094:939-2945(-)
MVLQRSPAKSAIYGFLGPLEEEANQDDITVKVSLYKDEEIVYTETNVMINATKQPFGPDFGVRPCSKKDCPPYDMMPFNPWNRPLATWKVLLKPMDAGGNYTIVVTLGDNNKRISITNVTFGDVWYCSGQSNMWLPVENSFSRNESVEAISNGRYNNLRIMAGGSGSTVYGKNPSQNWNPGYGRKGGSNPWMTAQQAIQDGSVDKPTYSLFKFGASCWYFGQRLAELGVDIPIGLTNTAIGGQRIEEYMNNATIGKCKQRGSSDGALYWDAQLFSSQVLPFVDMTVKGWVWYQGENNMFATKGNSIADIGYGCETRELIRGWRQIWSETPGTTDPSAPFGIVTLASSGSEGGANMGAMRHAQTANFGILPNQALPNTFLAQAYDLDDEWGPAAGPCFVPWLCCNYKNYHYNATTCTPARAKLCETACLAQSGTSDRGAIHPRNKKHVGDRLGTAAYNTVYGGKSAYTGPTLESCAVSDGELVIEFNSDLMRGDSLSIGKFPPLYQLPGRHQPVAGGTKLYVQTDSSHFCMESHPCPNSTNKEMCCPWWSGGAGDTVHGNFDDGWIMLNYTLSASSDTSIVVDLAPLNGAAPTAVRYAWGVMDCCDYSDPYLFVKHGCIASCPIMSSSNLPANPFQTKIVDGHCQCVPPQICSSTIRSDLHAEIDIEMY